MSRRALSLVAIALVVLAAGAVPAQGQDFDFAAVPRVTFGFTNQGPVGAVAATGVLSFNRSVFTGGIAGSLVSGIDTQVSDPGSTFEFSGGFLRFFSNNRSVTGIIGDEVLIGQALPAGHGLVAADYLGDSIIPFSTGLTALIEPHSTSFTQSNLTGDWRIKMITGAQTLEPPAGSTDVRFGTFTVGGTGTVTSGGTLFGFVGSPYLILGGNVTITSLGNIAGFLLVFDGVTTVPVNVQALMAPDKNFVAGVSDSDDEGALRNGMFFLQRAPVGISYVQADLAGVWNVFSLQGAASDSSNGSFFGGTVTFNATGHITDSFLVDGSTVLPALTGTVVVDSNGFLDGNGVFGDGEPLSIQATMFKEKNQIIGVNQFQGQNTSTFGLFTMFKQGPPPPASVVQFSTGNYSVVEGSTAPITVSRTGSTAAAVTVDFLADDPTLDQTLASGTLTIPAGAASATFAVPTIGNFRVDGDHFVALLLTNPTNGATLGARSAASLLVRDNDSAFAFSQPVYVVSESAGRATITVRRTGALAFPASVPFTIVPGTALPGRDYTPISTSLSFAANAASASVDVTILNNTRLDGNRSALLQVSPIGVEIPPTATLMITDDDTPGVVRLSSATYSGDEGKSVVLTIMRAPAVAGRPLGGNVSVDYTTSSNGSAVAGVNYAVTAGTVVFQNTDTTKTVSIPLLKDNVATGPQYFLFGLSNPTNAATLGTPSAARININDIDKGGAVTLSAGTYSVGEGAGNISITIKRSGGSAANASVFFRTIPGTATGDGVDYDDIATRVVFGLNETTKTVVVPIRQDTIAEGDETFTVMLSDPQGGATLGTPASAVVTIVDDESAIQFSQSVFTAKEGTPGKIFVTRSGALVTPSVVSYNISSLTAVPGVDFTGPLSGTLTFAPKITSAGFTIPTLDNTRVDGNRSVLITLGTPTGGAQTGTRATAIFTIVDDDQPGVFRMGSASYAVKEGDSVAVDIVRGPAPGVTGPLAGNVSIGYATVSGNASAGSDFVPVSGTIVFGPLETKRTVTIRTLQNTIVDPGKFFLFGLNTPTGGAALGAPSAATVAVQDDDVAGIVFLSQRAYLVNEGAGNISITVMRSGGTANASVRFDTVIGTASDGSDDQQADYGRVSTTVDFGFGETSKTVVIPIYQDNLPEGNEVFTVVLSSPQGGLRLGTPSSAPVTIVDDEVVIQFNGRFTSNKPVVVRTGPLAANVSVDYVVTSGTADVHQRLIIAPGPLVFPPGVGLALIPIKVINDNIAQGPQTFSITLVNPTAPAQLGPFSTQEFTIADNDFGGNVGFGNTSPTATLGQTKPMTIVRTGGAGTVMTVGWSAIGGTGVPGADFSPASGQVIFLANQSAQTFFVNVGAAAASAGKTVVFGLTIPGGDAAKFQPGKNVSTLTILGAPAGPSLELISKSTSGVRGDGNSVYPAVSADGRYVAFLSHSSNLAPGAGSAGFGVYVRDRVAGATELASVAMGVPEDGFASDVAISDDGRFVAFTSTSTNLVPNDHNGFSDVFVRDRTGAVTTRVSVPPGGGDANGQSFGVAISGNGNVVAFTSEATNLGGNGSALYAYDRTTGLLDLIASNGESPALSVDGRFVAFVQTFGPDGPQAYVFDRTARTLELVSQTFGLLANGTVVDTPAITRDGRFVAFVSDATNFLPDSPALGPAPTPPAAGPHVYVYDRTAGTLELVSLAPNGIPGDDASNRPSLSDDGRFVGFTSLATNLVTGDTNARSDVFVRDRAAGLTRRVDVLGSVQANGNSNLAALSGTGTFLAFDTADTALTAGDLNDATDVLGVTLTIPPAPTADIAITNSANASTVTFGALVRFTVTARNNGPAAASGVTVTDLLPAGYALVSATPSLGSYASGSGVWSVGALASNASATLTLTATVLAGGPYATVATRTASTPADPNAANDSATAGVTPLALTLTTDGPLVAVGRSIGGLVTLPSPASGNLSVSLTAVPAGIVSVPPLVAIPSGASSAPFTVTGLVVGNASITGTTAGLASGNVSVTVTSSVISLGALPSQGPGQAVSLPVSLSVSAPGGGVTVSFTSSNTSIATVTPSVFIPGGAQVPAANPQVTGVAVGSASITASATGFAPDSRAANVVVSVSFTPSPFSVVVGTNKSVTVNISAPAPAGGFTFGLVTANTSIATVASPVTVQPGQTSVQAAVTGVVIGSTTLQATGSGLSSATLTVNVTVPPPITLSSLTVGKDLQASTIISLGAAAPAGGLPVTLTSSDPTKVRLSSVRTTVGSGSIVQTVSAGQFSGAFYVQALDFSGSVSLTATAPGYQNASSTVTLGPAGFIINSPGNFATTTLSGNTSMQIAVGALNAGTLNFSAYQELRPGMSPVSVALTATDQTGGPGVGSITAPAVFNPTDGTALSGFHPAVAGTSLLQIVTPAGFNTSANFNAITATVSAPRIFVNDQTIGKDLQVGATVSLEAGSPAGVAVTLTSADTSKLLLSTSESAAGNDSVTLNFGAGSTCCAIVWMQALDRTGSVTVTSSAPGYQNGSATVTLAPSGFIINSPGSFSTTTLSANTSIQIVAGRLTTPALALAAFQELRGGIVPVSVDVTATDQTGSGVGSITTSPLSFGGTTLSQFTMFQPGTAGTSLIQVVTPAGFNTSANFTSITATVTAPALSVSARTVGKDLQVGSSVFLGAPAPAAGLVVTLTSGDPTKFILSVTESGTGNGSITLAVAPGGTSATYWVQALDSTGTPTLTASAPGFTDGTATITLAPSGFIINSPGSFSTTTFSSNATIQIASVLLSPGTLTIAAYQELRGGISPVSVTVTATDQTGGPGVGAITTSPLVFNGTITVLNTFFDPAASGTSLIQIGTPTGFSTPANFQSITATVGAPTISVADATVGRDLQQFVNIFLGATPPSPVTVTVTVASTAVATISTSATTAGSSTLTFTNVTSTSVGGFYVQGLVSSGTTTITTQAPGYTDAISNVTGAPSGFIINSPGDFTTTAGAGNTTIQIASGRLDPATLNFSAYQDVRGGASVSVPVTAADLSGGPGVGSITTSPVSFTGGVVVANTQFDPAAVGTSQITVGVPTGFDAPSNFRQITVTVNP